MELRYKCLIIDHDDTSVDSTVKINYLAYLKIMKEMRPHSKTITPDEFMKYAFQGSISENYYKKIEGFSDDEIRQQLVIWMDYAKDKNPVFFDGFLDILRKFRNAGGYIVVASHSRDHMIRRHYIEFQKNLSDDELFLPDMIFGWSGVKETTKPHPNVIYNAISRLNNGKSAGLELKDILVLDDLKPGLEMANSAKVDFAWAGWGHDIPEIKKYMEENAKYSFSRIKDFENFIFIN